MSVDNSREPSLKEKYLSEQRKVELAKEQIAEKKENIIKDMIRQYLEKDRSSFTIVYSPGYNDVTKEQLHKILLYFKQTHGFDISVRTDKLQQDFTVKKVK